MQNVPQDQPKIDNKPPQQQQQTTTTPQSSPAKSETETFSEHRRYMSDSSESDDDSVSEEFEEDPQVEATKFLLNPDDDRAVDPETQARLEALLQAAGISQLAAKDGKTLGDPEVLRRLTSSVSCALDEAAAALTRMRSDNPRGGSGGAAGGAQAQAGGEKTSLVEACTDGDVGTVRKLLTEGRSVHETSEEGESLLSLACSAGYFELAQVLLAMHANVEDRGIKGECTPLMEAASAGHLDIVRLLVAHGADVNAQSTSGNTPLMYGCAGGHTEVVRFLLENGANVEDHNENGHTPLMEAASAGHVGLAKILLLHGAGINTHSNEFKESALTLACYKGHLDMVRFLLEAGADQEHKTDEMHTALMEASMDGHVDVARLLLDSGAQVNMPTDSFESPLTLAACGGHVDLAMLLIERGANIEEVNDEGYTPLMEAAREGHEEMVHLLLGQGANINAQTDETQETALTLACCGGFTEVADILLKGGADMELGASTPLMEAAQEGHLDLVKFLLENGDNVYAQTQTGDTALTYACENGHTDVADLLLQYAADLEHESEGGRTPLMKACRAGHQCTVQFLIGKGANVRRQTTNNDHTPLSLACAGGHLAVVELLLAHNADPNHKLKDNSTMLIEAAKGGHTNVVQLLLDYPHSMQPILLNNQQPAATNLAMLPGHPTSSRDSPLQPPQTPQPLNFFQPPSAPILQQVPEAVRIVHQDDLNSPPLPTIDAKTQPQQQQQQIQASQNTTPKIAAAGARKLMPKSRSTGAVYDGTLTSAEAQQVRTQPLLDVDLFQSNGKAVAAAMELLPKDEPNSNTLIDFIKNRKKTYNIHVTHSSGSSSSTDEGTTQKQQILEELHRVERELHGKQQQQQQQQHVFQYPIPQDQCPSTTAASTLPHMLNIDIAMQQQQQQQQQKQGLGSGVFPSGNLQVQNAFYTGAAAPLPSPSHQQQQPPQQQQQPQQPAFYFASLPTSVAVSLPTATTSAANTPIKFQSVASHTEVSQNTAISDRPKAKPVSKKEGKSIRKQQATQSQQQPQQQQQHFTYLPTFNQQLQPQIQTLAHQLFQPPQQQQQAQQQPSTTAPADIVNVQELDLDALDQDSLVLKEETHENILTASILHQIHSSNSIKALLPIRMEKEFTSVEDVVQSLEQLNTGAPIALGGPADGQSGLHVQPYSPVLDDTVIATLQQQQQQDSSATVEYFAMPASNGAQAAGHPHPHAHHIYPSTNLPFDRAYQAGFQAGYNMVQQQLAITQYSGAAQQQQQLAQNQQVAVQQQQPCPGGGVIAPCLDVDSETESNHDTALTLACAGGHEDLVELLINRGADIEHRDKKGFTPLILAATAGHEKVVEILLNRNADIEAQSERTKDTPLSLACSGGRYEVVEFLLNRNANKEHRNVSDYTPLSLAASGGYVNIIKLLLSHGAEINSRTGSKLGISPLMLAAMNGHTAAVKLLLDMGSDINAQIETNRNTALTLACFQGRHEVVSLLLDRKANVEHRAKTGLTPLMEAASGGYVEVGRVLLEKGADVNATPVPSSRDTALTIAADKGHMRFVELLLRNNAQIEVKNKKGNSPLWLAANGGHLPVVEILFNLEADIDSQDNRKVSCLMAAFRKGHVKVVKWMVNHVTQFPSDQEMMRYISTVSDKELLDKCQECTKIIRAAKETQAAKANKNASILLEELDMEKTREESKRLAAAKRRERKKKKKLEKKEERRKLLEENKKNENYDDKDKSKSGDEDKDEDTDTVPEANPSIRNGDSADKEEGDSGIDANSQGSCSSNDIQAKSKEKRKDKKKKKTNASSPKSSSSKAGSSKAINHESTIQELNEKPEKPDGKSARSPPNRKAMIFEATKSPADRDDFEATGSEVYVSSSIASKSKKFDDGPVTSSKGASTSPKQASKREEGWKEVVRKSAQTVSSTNESGVKKVSVPHNAISRVIGRGGSNINAIRAATGAHIEVEKQNKAQGDRVITIKGSPDATREAYRLITTLIKDPEVDILQMLPKTNKAATTTTTLWDKTQIGTKKNASKVVVVSQAVTVAPPAHQKPAPVVTTSANVVNRVAVTTTVKPRLAVQSAISSRTTAPRLVAQLEKNAAATASAHNSSSLVRLPVASSAPANKTTPAKALTSTSNPTFAAKLTETTSNPANHVVTLKPRSALPTGVTQSGPKTSSSTILSAQTVSSTYSAANNPQASPQKSVRPAPTTSAPPQMQHYTSPGKAPLFGSYPNPPVTPTVAEMVSKMARSSTPNSMQGLPPAQPPPPPQQQPPQQITMDDMAVTQQHSLQAQEYSLFNSSDKPMWRREHESQKPINFAAVTGGSANQSVVAQNMFQNEPPPQVDASKAPGYRGAAACSPVSSKTSSNSTTPPNISYPAYNPDQQPPKAPTIAPIGSRPQQQQQDDYQQYMKMGAVPMLSAAPDFNFINPIYPQAQSINTLNSRLNPKAPDFSTNYNNNKPSGQMFNGFPMSNSQNNNFYQQQQQQQQLSSKMHSMDQFNRNSLNNRFYMNMPGGPGSGYGSPQQQPPPTELITASIAGMTIQNLARVANSEIQIENAELGIVSPIMSPNQTMHMMNEAAASHFEDRKPQPIGTERARKAVYNSAGPMPETSWNMMGADTAKLNNRSWLLEPGLRGQGVGMNFPEDMPTYDFQSMNQNYMNTAAFYAPQQAPMQRPDFAMDSFKDMNWDTARNNIDLQENWTNKWQ